MKHPNYIDPKTSQTMSKQIALFLLELGLNEPQETFTIDIASELNTIDLNEPVTKPLLTKNIPNTGILSPVFKEIELSISLGLQDTTAGLLGAIYLKYNWTHSKGGSNGYSVTYMIVPSCSMITPKFSIMHESHFYVATNFKETQLREWNKEKVK